MLKVFIINILIFGLAFLLPFMEKLWGFFNKDVAKFVGPSRGKKQKDKNILRTKIMDVPYLKLIESLHFSPDLIKKLTTQSAIDWPYNVFVFFSLSSAFAGAILFSFLWYRGYLASPWYMSLCSTIIGVGACAYIPHLCLFSMARARIQAVDKHISSFIDLMLICLDAGLTLNQALEFVAKECEQTNPLLAQELERTNLDCTLFLSSNRAFGNLLERVPSRKIAQFVAVVQQHYNEGSLIQHSLYQMSINAYRDNMTVIAQRAQKIPGLLSAMSVVFTIPMIFIVIFGPYLQDMMDLFK